MGKERFAYWVVQWAAGVGALGHSYPSIIGRGIEGGNTDVEGFTPRSEILAT